MLVPFPDVPLAMSQGVIGGVATTFESVWTSKLNDSGLKYAFEDKQFFGQYIPMISQSFWSKQSKEIQNAILESWEIAATGQREKAAKAQLEAREKLISAGMKVATPSPEEILATRKMLMSIQDELIGELKIDANAVETASKALRKANVEF